MILDDLKLKLWLTWQVHSWGLTLIIVNDLNFFFWSIVSSTSVKISCVRFTIQWTRMDVPTSPTTSGRCLSLFSSEMRGIYSAHIYNMLFFLKENIMLSRIIIKDLILSYMWLHYWIYMKLLSDMILLMWINVGMFPSWMLFLGRY